MAYDNAGSSFSVLLGNGNGAFQAATNFPLPGTAPNGSNAVIADLTGDGIPDLIVSSAVPITGLFGFSVPVGGTIWTLPGNGDGNLDVAAASPADQTVTVLLGTGDGTLRTPIVYAAGNSPMALANGDLNGDGKPDLVMVDDTSNSVVTLLNNYVAGGNSACTAISPLFN